MPSDIGRSNYVTKQTREHIDQEDNSPRLNLNPWTVQNIVYKIIENYMVSNPPKSMGYVFDQEFDTSHAKSAIDLQIAYNLQLIKGAKRPSVFVSRAAAEIKYPTMGNLVGSNARESEEFKLALVSLPIAVSVVASPIGFAEQLADYVKQPLMYFAQAIQCDFGFERFRLASIGKPQIVVDPKENFVIELDLQVEYSDNWIVRGDDLKLKTFSASVFDSVLKKPFENQ